MAQNKQHNENLCDPLSDKSLDSLIALLKQRELAYQSMIPQEIPKPITLSFPFEGEYISAYRTTHSDVMSVTTAHQRKKYDRDEDKSGCVKKANPYKCRLPYTENNAPTVRTKLERGNKDIDASTTALSKRQAAVARVKLNKELHTEHRTYMKKLKAEREKRFRIENASANIIQRFYKCVYAIRRGQPEERKEHFTNKELASFVNGLMDKLGCTTEPLNALNYKFRDVKERPQNDLF